MRPITQIALDETWSALRFRPLAPGEAPFTGGRPRAIGLGRRPVSGRSSRSVADAPPQGPPRKVASSVAVHHAERMEARAMSHFTRRPVRVALILAWLVAAIAIPIRAAEPPTKYVALGDSLAWGDGATDPAQTAYVPLLADYFAGTPHGGAKQAVNLAVRGETTTSFLAGQLAAAMAQIGDPATDTRVVTLAIGGNDLLDLLNDATDPCVQDPSSPTCRFLVAEALGGVAARLPIILGSLSAVLAGDPDGARVYVMTLYNPFGGTGSPFEAAVDGALLGSDLRIDCAALSTDPTAAGLNDIVACTSFVFGATLVDSYPVIGDQALQLTHIGEPVFNIHPNDEGYALLARAHRTAP
jgi:lysophospholipase L1-like esterase